MSMELDQLDNLAASVFDGYLVRKDLVRKYSRQYPVPTYVVEFLLGRYCASVDESEIAEGLEIVEKQLKDRTVRTGEEELFKARAKETGSVKIIDILRASLDAKNDCYIAELPSLNLRDVRIDDQHGPRQRADADRRLLRRGHARLRWHHRPGKSRTPVQGGGPTSDPNVEIRRAWTSIAKARRSSAQLNGSTSCCDRSVLKRPPSTSGRNASCFFA